MTVAQPAPPGANSSTLERKPLPLALTVLASFTAANSCYHIATTILVPMLPLIRDSFGLSYFESGLLILAYTITNAFMQLVVAAIADRISKRLLAAMALLGVAVAAFSAGLSTGYFLLMASLVGVGVCGSLYRAPAISLLSQAVGTQWRGRAFGVHQIGGSIGHLIAPVLASLIAASAGWRWSFMVLSLPAALASLLIWARARLAEDALALQAVKKYASGEPFPWRPVVGPLVPFVLLAMGEQFVGSAVSSYLPLFLVDKHQVAPLYAGMLVGLIHGTGLIGAPLAGALSDRFGRKPVILGSVMAAGPALYLLAQAPFGAVVLGAMVIYGLIISFRMPVMESLIADRVPWERRGRVLSLYYFVSQGVTALGTPLVGRIMDGVGPAATFTGMSFLAFGLSLIVILIWRRL